MTEITVIELIDSKEAEKYQSSCGGLGGFFQDGMRWKNYLYNMPEKERPYLEAIRTCVVENKLKYGGFTHQSDSSNGVPLFSDDTIGDFSLRAWGDIMAAIWSEAENKDYNYVDFAWSYEDD